MEIKPIRTEADYHIALKEIEKLIESQPGTPDGDRMDVLVTLVEAYEAKHFPIPEPDDPVEVLESQMRKPGMWTVPGALEEALTGGADWRNGREEYCARMLGAICEAAIRERATLVNYSELPLAVGRLAHFFGVEYTAAEWEAMLAAAGFDAKSPCFAFTADGEEKRRRASGAVVEAAARWIGAAYQELEVLRRGGRGLPE